jgi:hypothetical protein
MPDFITRSASFFAAVGFILSVIIYGYTIYLASDSGIFSAILTAILPALAQVFWLAVIAFKFGYQHALIALVAACIASFIIAATISTAGERAYRRA